MIVRLAAEAERDLEAIGDRIADDDPQRALSFVQEIRAHCLALRDFPWSHVTSGTACVIACTATI